MTKINGIGYDDFNFSDNSAQIGGEKAKDADKINYSEGLTRKEAKRIDVMYGNNDGIIEESEFIDACLNDDVEVSGIKSKSKDELKTVYNNYVNCYSNSVEENKDEDKEETPVVKSQSGSTLPKSLSFGYPKNEITNIKSGDKEGEYFQEMTMNNQTYKKSGDVKKNSSGIEVYTMKPETEDGSKIVVEKYANGMQFYTVYGTDGKAKSQLQLDENGKAKSIFRYDDDGYAYEREYLAKNGVIRKYERGDDHKLVSSKDYKKNDDGTIDENKPTSYQEYIYLDELGGQWSKRELYEYDDDGKLKATTTETYDYDQERDGTTKELTGKMTIDKKVYDGKSTKDDDMNKEVITEMFEGIIQKVTTIEKEKGKEKKKTEVTYNKDGSTTTKITEDGHETIIEKDDQGNVTKKTVDGKVVEDNTDDENKKVDDEDDNKKVGDDDDDGSGKIDDDDDKKVDDEKGLTEEEKKELAELEKEKYEVYKKIEEINAEIAKLRAEKDKIGEQKNNPHEWTRLNIKIGKAIEEQQKLMKEYSDICSRIDELNKKKGGTANNDNQDNNDSSDGSADDGKTDNNYNSKENPETPDGNYDTSGPTIIINGPVTVNIGIDVDIDTENTES